MAKHSQTPSAEAVLSQAEQRVENYILNEYGSTLSNLTATLCEVEQVTPCEELRIQYNGFANMFWIAWRRTKQKDSTQIVDTQLVELEERWNLPFTKDQDVSQHSFASWEDDFTNMNESLHQKPTLELISKIKDDIKHCLSATRWIERCIAPEPASVIDPHMQSLQKAIKQIINKIRYWYGTREDRAVCDDFALLQEIQEELVRDWKNTICSNQCDSPPSEHEEKPELVSWSPKPQYQSHKHHMTEQQEYSQDQQYHPEDQNYLEDGNNPEEENYPEVRLEDENYLEDEDYLAHDEERFEDRDYPEGKDYYEGEEHLSQQDYRSQLQEHLDGQVNFEMDAF